MLPSRHGKRTAVEDHGQEERKIKLECVSEIEQEQDMLATTVDPLLTNVKMSCSDSEDPFADCTVAADSVSHISHANKPTPTPTIVTSSVLALQNEGTSNEFTPSRVVNMFRLVLENVKRVQASTDSMRQELSNIFQRLERVEKKVGISLATLETVKDGMVMNTDVPETQNDDPSEPRFVFKKISNEEEFTEFDFKLASDEEYYSNVKKWLNQQIGVDDPNNRMLVAMDLLMERKFFAQCTWTGISFEKPRTSKIAFGRRTDVLKLFKDIGSNNLVTLNQALVEKFFRMKLRSAKRRATISDARKPACHKLKRTAEPNRGKLNVENK